MRYIVVGLGNIGAKRQALIGRKCIATVDPANSTTDFHDLDEVPLDTFDAAILAVPNTVKLKLMRRLLAQGKHVLVEKPILRPVAPLAARFRCQRNAKRSV